MHQFVRSCHEHVQIIADYDARSSGDAPYSNGAVAALAGFVVIEIIAVVVRVVGDKPLHPGRIVGTGLIAYAAGLLGGVVATYGGRNRS